MNLIIFVTLIALSSAAELPSSNYLPPQNQVPQHPPSTSYLPSNQIPSHTIAITGQQGSLHGQTGSGGDTGNRRPQQEAEKNAVILSQEQEITENGFHYAYETSNGIRAEEGGDASQSQGGFSYKGDDGQTYTVIFSAGEGGFRPQGDHLPEPPPTPREILLALEQNARDEAAGIFDDGLYHPEVHGGPQAGGKPGSSYGYGTGSQSSSSSGQGFGGANHQGSFNPNSGYNY